MEPLIKLTGVSKVFLTDEVERRRLVLTEADRQVRVLEKLKERKREDAVRLEQRQEMKQLDEAAATGFLRKRRELAGEAAP